MKGIKLALIVTLAFGALITEAALHSLCDEPGCQCSPAASADNLVDVTCECSSNVSNHKQVLRIGSLHNSHNAAHLPENIETLRLDGCHHIEVFSKVLNHAHSLKNISISDSANVVLHHRLFQSRNGKGGAAAAAAGEQSYSSANGHSLHLKKFRISEVRSLKVHRHSFEGIMIDDLFELDHVDMDRVPSLAFNFDFVNEFTIKSCHFVRVAMWGFKLEQCNEFNVLQKSSFFSMASQAFRMQCNKFMLAYNKFRTLQDASLGVTFGLADIQGNSFETFIGKPFVDLKPLPAEAVGNYQSGFVFRENFFAADPKLPFNSLSMPEFGNLVNSEESGVDSYVDIEANHFKCQCDRLAWLPALMEFGFDADLLKAKTNGGQGGSMAFLKAVYSTADQCITCGIDRCQTNGKSFHEFAKAALGPNANGHLACKSSGKPLKSQDPTRKNEPMTLAGDLLSDIGRSKDTALPEDAGEKAAVKAADGSGAIKATASTLLVLTVAILSIH